MALLKTLAEFKRYVTLDATQALPPAVALALPLAEQVLAALLGPPLKRWLQQQYDAPGFDLDEAGSLAAELLRLVQAPLARLAKATALPEHQVSFSNTGLHIVSNDAQKTAFQWQNNQLVAALLGQAHTDLDVLVQWLEDNYESAPELQAWAASPAGQRHRRELFTSTASFGEYERISGSRAVFEALRPTRRHVEAGPLATALGEDFLLELRDQVRTRTLSSENRMLLDSRVYPALASLTIAHAVPALGLELTGTGINLAVARADDSNAKEADASLDQLLGQKVSEAALLGQRYLRQLRDYLDRSASATRFATYFHSPAYTSPTAEPVVLNAPDTKLFKFF